MKIVMINKINMNAYDTLCWNYKKRKKYILGVVYRPPKLSKENDIILYDEIKSIIYKNAVIWIDFNNLSVNWLTLTGDRVGIR